MPLRALAAGSAIILAATGLTLAHRSRVCARLYIRRGMCPHCRKILSLPLRRCPLCGTEFKEQAHWKAMDPGYEGARCRERVLMQRGQILILLAWIVFLTGSLIERI